MKVSSLKRKAKQPPTPTRLSARLLAKVLTASSIRKTKAKQKALHSMIVAVAKASKKV